MYFRNKRSESLFEFIIEFGETVPIRIKLTIHCILNECTAVCLGSPPDSQRIKVKASFRCQRVDFARSNSPAGNSPNIRSRLATNEYKLFIL